VCFLRAYLGYSALRFFKSQGATQNMIWRASPVESYLHFKQGKKLWRTLRVRHSFLSFITAQSAVSIK
jgi:frataxin-like iron-binding protein CyaY